MPTVYTSESACRPLLSVNETSAVRIVPIATGKSTYEAQFPGCRWLNGDIDGNGSVDFDDIDRFVECIIDGGC
jgi:hypothetical protein